MRAATYVEATPLRVRDVLLETGMSYEEYSAVAGVDAEKVFEADLLDETVEESKVNSVNMARNAAMNVMTASRPPQSKVDAVLKALCKGPKEVQPLCKVALVTPQSLKAIADQDGTICLQWRGDPRHLYVGLTTYGMRLMGVITEELNGTPAVCKTLLSEEETHLLKVVQNLQNQQRRLSDMLEEGVVRLIGTMPVEQLANRAAVLFDAYKIKVHTLPDASQAALAITQNAESEGNEENED